ncbi:uncharacterized protein LOC132619407 [Lycium barbarum]|uniref:uncharacterized protein LOC132619407 n=1 Tax=Lycium barbarum TaxID=112863 RepID=UPI00293E2FD8|nr:uncharacterized protein LOC132619407 [Lycium barbarum]
MVSEHRSKTWLCIQEEKCIDCYKAGMVNGKILKPSDDSPILDCWLRCNAMAFAWLSNSLSKDIGESVLHCETARDIWLDLEDRYGQTNVSRYYQIQREIAGVVQGSSDIASYFTKLRRLWDELRSASFGPVCSCGAEPQCSEGEKLIEFLTGLNDTYSNVRSNILMMSPIPSLGKAYSMLLHDESQREIQSSQSSFILDSTSFSAKSTSHASGSHTSTPHDSHTSLFTISSKGYSQRVSFDNRKSSLVCKYYKKTGHSVEQCYKLHGFPTDFKFTKTENQQHMHKLMSLR